MQIVICFAVVAAIVLMSLLLATYVGNTAAYYNILPYTKKQRDAIYANISSSTWLGDVFDKTDHQIPSFNDESIHHANPAITMSTTQSAKSDKPKWKYGVYVDVGKTAHIFDKLPHLSLDTLQSWPLYDMKTMNFVLPEQITADGVSLYEKLPNGEFRFRVKCTAPYVPHVDFPWSCFKCPCSKNLSIEGTLYDPVSKKCECGKLLNAEINDKSSVCVPNDSLEFYDQKREIVQIRVPCWNGDNDVIRAYPCPQISPKAHKVSSARLRLRILPYNHAFQKLPEARTDLAAGDEYKPFDVIFN